MKLFKRKCEFRLFGIHIIITLSNYRYGYRRGEKEEIKVDAEQMAMVLPETQESERV
jgi:hypothetical protein